MLAVAGDLDAVKYSIYYPGHGTVRCWCADSRSSVADGHIKAYLQLQKIIFEAVFSHHCIQISVWGENKFCELKKWCNKLMRNRCCLKGCFGIEILPFILGVRNINYYTLFFTIFIALTIILHFFNIIESLSKSEQTV